MRCLAKPNWPREANSWVISGSEIIDPVRAAAAALSVAAHSVRESVYGGGVGVPRVMLPPFHQPHRFALGQFNPIAHRRADEP